VTSILEVPAALGGDVALKPVEPVLIYKHRDVPPEWEQRLRESSPISDVHSWLAFRWFDEAQRWMLYDCLSIRFVTDNSLIEDLGGPDPETPEGEDVLVSRFQQEMFRKHRVLARPCWVIQGTRGGHHASYTKAQQEDHRALGLPTEPPKPGDLPYADFDERVVRHLIEMSKLVRFKNDFGEFKRRFGTVDGQKREAANALKAARERYVKWINSQFEDGDDLLRTAYQKGELEDAPKTDDDFVEKNELADENYIRRGRFSAQRIKD
jgi:hypothetical protein